MYALKTPTADLIEWGAGIASPKVLTDLLRAVGDVAAFLPNMTAAQKKLLLGFSPALLSVAAAEGLRLVDMNERFRGANGDRTAAEVDAEAKAAADYAEGMSTRERVANALMALVSYDASLESTVTTARGRVTDAKTLADSLLKLVKVANGVRAKKSSQLAAQLEDGGMTAELLADVEALAARVKESGAAITGARKAGPVTQAELDHQDGVCLTFYERLMKIFNAAHAVDPKIPQIVPIATRRLFRKSKGASAQGAADAPADPAAKPEK
jgi:HPt (histidine-containing phosphotransfer) domain-containing protein